MLLEGVLSIGIRADFWQPQKNERKAELIKYWHQRAVLDRMNIQISKELHTTMSRPFYSDAKKAKNVSFSSSPSHFLFPRYFSGTIAEPLRPADLRCAFWGLRRHCSPFWGWNTPKTPILRAWIGVLKPNGRNIESFMISILTKFGVTIKTIKWSSWVVPVGAQQIQDGGRPPFW